MKDAKHALLVQALERMRGELEAVLRCEVIGGVMALDGAGPLRVERGVIGEIEALVPLIRAAEDEIGREGAGPEWLDAVIDGQRDVVPA